jgi:hypothetical protein
VAEAVSRGEGLEGDSNSTMTGGVEDLDDYFRCKIEKKSDLKDLFVPRFYFGCEADDPTNAWAVQPEGQPHGRAPQRPVQLGRRATSTSRTWPTSSPRPTSWSSTASSNDTTSATSCSPTPCASGAR